MRLRRFWIGLALAGLGFPSWVAAQPATQAPAATSAVMTSSANVRAGPDRHFPTVTWLLGGKTVQVVGCVESWRWCDVIAGRDRGWVYSRYLAVEHQGAKVTVARGGPTLGLPVVAFTIAGYWGEHYRDRRWFADQPYWERRLQNRPAQPEWRPPAPPRGSAAN